LQVEHVRKEEAKVAQERLKNVGRSSRRVVLVGVCKVKADSVESVALGQAQTIV
jgi:hypothetical protein